MARPPLASAHRQAAVHNVRPWRCGCGAPVSFGGKISRHAGQILHRRPIEPAACRPRSWPGLAWQSRFALVIVMPAQL
ncbi:hypothetical protein [Rhodopila sp.]|uniref:hypothetical protein n=1 Tax=Rhodopila sp. TaxID=2480087 RepID=UPI003D13071D